MLYFPIRRKGGILLYTAPSLIIINLSRGELHASKWCRRTKERSIEEGKKEREGRV